MQGPQLHSGLDQLDLGFYVVLSLPIHMALLGNLLTPFIRLLLKWRHRVQTHSIVARAKENNL